MQKKTLSILEYDKVLSLLSECAFSDTGRAVCLSAQPSNTLQSVRWELGETRDADDAWARCSGNPMESFQDCSEILARCASGSVPAPLWLLQVSDTLRAIRTVKKRLTDNKVQNSIRNLASALVPINRLEEEISHCIRSEDELYDNASPQLSGIRRRMRTAEERIRARLQDIVSSQKDLLQDAIITQRNGRYVVPVKTERLREIKGLEHDRSQSGATVFVEPLSVLEANNELRELGALERSEIERILLSLGAMVAEGADDIRSGIQAMGKLDFAFAKAGLARKMRAVPPEIKDGDVLDLEAARHPLIPDDSVVPIDVRTGGETRALIVTGPNTGGKTVTLKTAGLFSLMAQTGLFLPCEKAVLPVFSEIYADIGDEQSIEQSLSTFSSHMVTLVEIIKNSGPGVFVLMDELGAGTDPVEGAALAIAILEEVTGRGATAIATTHYSELKSYAITTEGFLNAGMEFDVKTLSPTYRLMIGYAGSSNAFEISRRLGLSQGVIERAREHVSKEAADFDAALAKADSLRLQAMQEVERMKFERERNLREMEQQRLLAAKELAQERAQAKEMLEKARSELAYAREAANEAIEAARIAAREDSMAARDRALQKAREKLKTLPEIDEQEEKPNLQPAQSLMPGDIVYFNRISANATVLEPPDEKGEVQLQAGVMKINANITDLMLVTKAGKGRQEQINVRRKGGSGTVRNEIDVRGMTVYEAQMAIDLQLDAAVMAGLHVVSIIHGKGTGALRDGIRGYLRKHPHVGAQRPGTYGEGEDGVTVVELK